MADSGRAGLSDPPASSAAPVPLEGLIRQFSCPSEGQNALLAETIAVTHAREVAGHFLERFGPDLITIGSGIDVVVEDWLASETDFDVSWSVPFGQAYEVLTQSSPGSEAVKSSALWLATHLSAVVAQSEWRSTVPAGMRLRWGPWILPPASHIAVQSDGMSAEVVLQWPDQQQRLEFRRKGGRGGWNLGDPVRRTESLSPEPDRDLLLMAAPDAVVPFPEAEGSGVCPLVEPDVLQSFEAAFELLRSHAPTYLRWVSRVVHSALLVQRDVNPGLLRSGSAANMPGFVFVLASHNPTAIAEMLVHEATHQYYHLVCRVGPVADESDRRRYVSPFVGVERPLSRIVAAYHAFANVAIFYDACICGGANDATYCQERQSALLPKLEACESAVVCNPALTAIGRGLCFPLVDRIGALRRESRG